MFKAFATAMLAAVACAAPGVRNGNPGRSYQTPSAVMSGLLKNEKPAQYAAEMQWYVDAVSSGKISIGLTHPNVTINETIESFTQKFNAWLLQNESMQTFLSQDPEVWSVVHAKFHAYMLSTAFGLQSTEDETFVSAADTIRNTI